MQRICQTDVGKQGLTLYETLQAIGYWYYQQRDEQFKIIFALIAVIMNMGMPVISIVCKKKEVISNLYR